ncbi:hypothetical protein C1H46_031650 [Malus baccata]|uniref:Leucine-rich repeat-containing N-terminal plant-type domain-containing protein n=1 Tax=Malus baccata TaxID=106549 RepID=A0A540L8N6_MALBA|nr:hypothetical protein C1H46_031650 [Malus baccata]
MAAMAAMAILLLTSFFFATLHVSSNPDTEPLLSFKATSDASNKLTTWNFISGDPCTSTGVSCTNNRVSRLILEKP